MPIPVNIVIPVDMGSNIVNGSTVQNALAGDANRWVATIDKDGVLIYPRMSSAVDFGSPAAVDDDRVVSAGLLALAIQQAIAAVGDTHLAAVTYNVEQRLLKFVETSGNSWDIVIPISDGTMAGLVKLSKEIDWPAASLDDSTATTPAYVEKTIAAAMAGSHPALAASSTSTAIPIAWNAATQMLSIGFDPQNAVNAIVNDAVAQAALQAAIDTSLLINDGSQVSDPTDAVKALSAAGFNTMASTISAASNEIQQAIVAAVEAWALDKLDFAHFKDAMTIDAPTTIEHNNNNLALIGVGKFGVGVAAPAFRLDVGGTATVDRKIGINGTQALYVPDQALFSNSIGIGSATIGSLQHAAGVDGFNNIAVGDQAGNSITTGYSNIAVGVAAMLGATGTTNSAVALGTSALRNATNINATAAVGDQAGMYCASASSAFVGRAAGYRATGDSIAAVGPLAGAFSFIANSVAIGNSANNLARNADSVAVGVYALANSASTSSTAVGHSAGHVTAGGSATYVGYHSGRYTLGSSNTGIGYRAFLSAAPVAAAAIAVTAVDLVNSTMTLATPHGVAIGTSNLFFLSATTAPTPMSNNAWYAFTAVDNVTLRMCGNLSTAGVDVTLAVNMNATITNATAIGANSLPSASNEIKLGNSAVTAVRTDGAYYGTAFNVVSDARLKTDLRSIPDDIAVEFSRVVNILDFTRIADNNAAIREAEQHNSSIDFDIMNLNSEISELLAGFEKSNGVSLDEMYEKIEVSEGEINIEAGIQSALDEYEAKNAEIMARDSERIVISNEEIVKLYDDTGVIAQEIQKLAEKTGYGAHLVHEDAHGMLTVNTTALMFIIARGFQLRLEKAGI